MRRRAPRQISIAMRSLSSELAPQSPLASIQTAWESVVGAQIAAHCLPAAERGGTLTVDCDAAVWAAEMEMRSPELLASLNAALRPVASISTLRFRVRDQASGAGG